MGALMTMACPVHGGSLATPCHCEPTVNARRVEALLWPLALHTLPNVPLDLASEVYPEGFFQCARCCLPCTVAWVERWDEYESLCCGALADFVPLEVRR